MSDNLSMSISKRILGISDSKSVFVSSNEEPRFFELMAGLVRKSRPRICYIGAARGDNPERIGEFFELAARVGCEAKVLQLFSMVTDNPDEYFADTDIIFIDGGATRNLIALMREWNVIGALVEAYERGTLIVGASAGISMLFNWCASDSLRTRILPVPGIGLLKGSICAHYDVLPERRTVLKKMIEDQATAAPGYGLEDGVGVLFCGQSVKAVYALEGRGKLHSFKQSEAGIIEHTTQTGEPLDAATPLPTEVN